MMRRRPKRNPFSHTVTGWAESTYAEQAWEANRGAGLRWGLWGAAVGALIALLLFAPAAWLASAVASATGERVLLSDARGTVWSGSAVLVLTGGADSRDANSLPGRLQWTLAPRPTGFELRARHACCLNGAVGLLLRPGFGRMHGTLLAPADWVGQWPSSLLAGLGTPWNTLQLGGAVRLTTPGLAFEQVQGRLRLEGELNVELLDVSSRLSTLDTLGNYRLTLTGDPATPGTSQLLLSTLGGALQLNGTGTWGPGGVRFRGEATSAMEDEAALNNLLNIIGRRSGARSVISIG